MAQFLPQLKDVWAIFSSKSSISMLLKCTNDTLSTCASATHKSVDLGKTPQVKSNIDPNISKAQNQLLRLSKHVRLLTDSGVASQPQLIEAKAALSGSRSAYRRLVNASSSIAANKRDNLVHSVLSSDPSSLYKTIRQSKNPQTSKLPSLRVSDKVYSGSAVPDGFFDSLSSLKSPDMSRIYLSTAYKDTSYDFSIIKKICSTSLKIPEISSRDASDLLYSLRRDVNDLFSITA